MVRVRLVDAVFEVEFVGRASWAGPLTDPGSVAQATPLVGLGALGSVEKLSH